MIQVCSKEVSREDVKNRLSEFRKTWPRLVRQISGAFSYSKEKQEWLEEKSVAQLIGAIPFLAGCLNPLQTAASHLAIYLLSVEQGSKEIFHHKMWTDDSELMNRLKPISHFEGGNQDIIARGMDLLALTMVYGYQRDIEKDKNLRKYNPLSSGAWNYEKIKNTLISRLENNLCLSMDEVFDIDISPMGYWGV